MNEKDIADTLLEELLELGRHESRVERDYGPLVYVISEQHDDARFLSIDCDIASGTVVGITFSHFSFSGSNFDVDTLRELATALASANVVIGSEKGWLRSRGYATLTIPGFEPVKKPTQESSFIELNRHDLVALGPQ